MSKKLIAEKQESTRYLTDGRTWVSEFRDGKWRMTKDEALLLLEISRHHIALHWGGSDGVARFSLPSSYLLKNEASPEDKGE